MINRFTRDVRRRSAVTLNLAAMVDVVFQLLLFFMCASQWRRPEGALPANIPTGSGREIQAPDERPDLPPILVRIDGQGDAIRIRCQENPIADMAALAQQLGRLAAIDRSVPVIVDARGTVAFRWVVAALNASLKADLTNVAFTAPAVEPRPQ
jgi:biopolymer transport protein ExbD